MPSPILTLQENLIHAFENPNGSAVAQLRDVVTSGLLSNELNLDESETPPMAPRTERIHKDKPATLVIHVPFLELVWAISYGWMILYEECVQRPMLEQRFEGRIDFDSELKVRALRLLIWADSLKKEYSAWPVDLPSPKNFSTDEEEAFCLKANYIFQQSMAFMLFHEFAHVKQGHLEFMTSECGSPDAVSILEMEREADEFAYRVLVSSDENEIDLANKAWAVLIAAISSLHLTHSTAGVFQRKHPHLHHRLNGFLEKLAFPAGRYKDYFQYLCATVLLLTQRRAANDGKTEPDLFDDADTALEAELDALDQIIQDITRPS